jgi:hypothetical protein
VLSNKELKLTKPSQDGASQLNSVFAELWEGHAGMAITYRSWLALPLLVLTQADVAAQAVPKPNVIASDVRGIPAWPPSDARVLAVVVDHEGRPMEGIAISVFTNQGREAANGVTDAQGRVILSIAVVGRVTVRASHVGFITAEARRVELQRSRLTAVALPLEVAGVSDPITSGRP